MSEAKTLTWHGMHFPWVAVEQETVLQGWHTDPRLAPTGLATFCTMLLRWSRGCGRRNPQWEAEQTASKKNSSTLNCLYTETQTLKDIKCLHFRVMETTATSQSKRQVWFYPTGLGGRPTHKKVIPSIKLRAWSPRLSHELAFFSLTILTNHLINTCWSSQR